MIKHIRAREGKEEVEAKDVSDDTEQEEEDIEQEKQLEEETESDEERIRKRQKRAREKLLIKHIRAREGQEEVEAKDVSDVFEDIVVVSTAEIEASDKKRDGDYAP